MIVIANRVHKIVSAFDFQFGLRKKRHEAAAARSSATSTLRPRATPSPRMADSMDMLP